MHTCTYYLQTIKKRRFYQLGGGGSPLHGLYISGAPAAQRAAKQSPILIMRKKRKPMSCNDFLMVIMARGIAPGHVRTTTATTTTTTAELPNMVAIVQRRHRALVYRVLL